MISKHILWITYLNEPELIFFHTVKWFHYFNQIWIILFIINHLFAHSLILSGIDMYH